MIARGMSDVARQLHPEDDQFFTWWAPWRNMRQRNIGWRIDYIFATAPLASQAKTCVLATRGRHQRSCVRWS